MSHLLSSPGWKCNASADIVPSLKSFSSSIFRSSYPALRRALKIGTVWDKVKYTATNKVQGSSNSRTLMVEAHRPLDSEGAHGASPLE